MPLYSVKVKTDNLAVKVKNPRGDHGLDAHPLAGWYNYTALMPPPAAGAVLKGDQMSIRTGIERTLHEQDILQPKYKLREKPAGMPKRALAPEEVRIAGHLPAVVINHSRILDSSQPRPEGDAVEPMDYVVKVRAAGPAAAQAIEATLDAPAVRGEIEKSFGLLAYGQALEEVNKAIRGAVQTALGAEHGDYGYKLSITRPKLYSDATVVVGETGRVLAGSPHGEPLAPRSRQSALRSKYTALVAGAVPAASVAPAVAAASPA